MTVAMHVCDVIGIAMTAIVLSIWYSSDFFAEVDIYVNLILLLEADLCWICSIILKEALPFLASVLFAKLDTLRT